MHSTHSTVMQSLNRIFFENKSPQKERSNLSFLYNSFPLWKLPSHYPSVKNACKNINLKSLQYCHHTPYFHKAVNAMKKCLKIPGNREKKKQSKVLLSVSPFQLSCSLFREADVEPHWFQCSCCCAPAHLCTQSCPAWEKMGATSWKWGCAVSWKNVALKI